MKTKISLLTILFLTLYSTLTAQYYYNNIKKTSNDTLKRKNYEININTTGYLAEDNFFEYLGLRYGKFLLNDFSAGAEIGRSFYGYYERGINFGLFGRYYFAKFNHFAYFSEAKYLFGLRKYNNQLTLSKWNGTSNNFALNLGVRFTGIYKKRFGIDFFSGYGFNTISIKNHPTLGKYTYSKHEISYGFQLNFYF